MIQKSDETSQISATTMKQDEAGIEVLDAKTLMSFAQGDIIDADAEQERKFAVRPVACAAVIEVE